ncbi:hypothetical protein OH492_11725 [Vibrio chagasii]|nr:hypothetical protein [Vibrio chagasii]
MLRKRGFRLCRNLCRWTDERRARLDWSDEEYELRRLCEKHQMPLPINVCKALPCKFPVFGSMDEGIRTESFIIMEKSISLAYKLGIRCIQMAGYDVYYEPQSSQTRSHALSMV